MKRLILGLFLVVFIGSISYAKMTNAELYRYELLSFTNLTIQYCEMRQWNTRHTPKIFNYIPRGQGFANYIYGEVLGANPYVVPFEKYSGLMSARMANEASPNFEDNNREGAYNYFRKAFPNIWSTPNEFRALVNNFINNSFLIDKIFKEYDVRE